MELLIGLISGALGANVAAGLLRNINLGLFGNALAGVVGAGIGAKALSVLGDDGLSSALGGGDAGVLWTHAVTGALGGAAVLLALGSIRNMLVK
ncbi:MAG: hypothetical protein ACQEVT_01575 [Pseudomonadota bacterium]|uniref:hypothetical protein n=1 Tax=Roseovarius TaxID=74030 RepID=UPI0022A73AEC|nr:hypothetical protein [Roseovarius sp. EGI FJ00037]MCZ0811136.1 hypothetical protein [Roseovarius sp. EGI FJ00037]